jgi:hypothetical protein
MVSEIEALVRELIVEYKNGRNDGYVKEHYKKLLEQQKEELRKLSVLIEDTLNGN